MPAPIRNVDDLGFPLPGSFDELTGQPSRPKRTWGQFFYKYRWGVLLLLIPLLFGDSLFKGVRHFVAERLLENAEARFNDDHLEEALASANRALFWEPDSFEAMARVFRAGRTFAKICPTISKTASMI